MAKTKQQKSELVDRLADKLARMKGGAMISVHGYTMTDADRLREQGRAVGVELGVTKKSLLKIAADKAGITDFDPKSADGSILFAFGFQDEVAAAKLLAQYLKGKEQMTMLGGVLEKRGVDAAAAKRLASLPGKQELLAQAVGSLKAPISGFANVLAGNLRGLVRVLSAIQEAKG